MRHVAFIRGLFVASVVTLALWGLVALVVMAVLHILDAVGL